MKTKVCIGCGIEKELVEFGRCKSCKDGTRNECKSCLSIKQSERMKDPERQKRRKEYNRLWNKNNRQHVREYVRNNSDKRNRARREKYANDIEHREELKRRSKEWQKSNPKKRKASRLKQYDLSLDDFNEMLEEQDYKCAICGHSDMTDKNFFLLVDHCHDTNEVRGLLCMNCNQGLGKFQDDIKLLQNAIDYLEATQ